MTDRASNILRIRSETRDGVPTLVLSGELDYGGIGELEAAYAEAYAAEPERIVVDLSGLEFADCSAVRLLMEVAGRCSKNGNQLAIRRGPARVQRVFELTGTADRLPFVQ